jgi:C1A family cysteine protease
MNKLFNMPSGNQITQEQWIKEKKKNKYKNIPLIPKEFNEKLVNAKKQDKLLSKATLDDMELPSSFNSISYLTKIKDQGMFGSCTGNAVASWCEYFDNIYGSLISGEDKAEFSALYSWWSPLYYNNFQLGECNGRYTNQVMRNALDYGCALEKDFPYSLLRTCPPLPIPSDELINKTEQKSFRKIYNLPDSNKWATRFYFDNITKKSLIELGAVVASISVYEEFYDSKPYGCFGFTPHPVSNYIYGHHAVLVVGYDDNMKFYYNGKWYKGAIIVQNSWGEDWCCNGFTCIPYEYADEYFVGFHAFMNSYFDK